MKGMRHLPVKNANPHAVAECVIDTYLMIDWSMLLALSIDNPRVTGSPRLPTTRDPQVRPEHTDRTAGQGMNLQVHRQSQELLL
jgi:hypothetical protein